MSRSSSSTGTSRETSPMEGLLEAPIHRFTGIRNLQKDVRSQSAELQAGRSNQQYLIFRGVTKRHLAEIDRKRASIGKHTRMTHHTNTDLLIVKLMPSAKHEAAHLTLADDLNHKLEGMGIPKRSLFPLGGTRFSGSSSSKEGDAANKPRSRSQETDWPTIVFESGLSETLARLRHDAGWWLANSEGSVKIVIIISITPEEKRLQVEKWCLSQATTQRPTTRAHPNPSPLVPTRMQEITITQNPTSTTNSTAQPGTTIQQSTATSCTVAGAPLILEFEKLLLRAPVPPEDNVILTATDLSDWANDFWSILR
ncbi:uncharacterized protein Z518_10466 [Rhinocladiella mackenziei CBS 650.93]|uniref:Uncharacterized protein n=1 Tax=Rhinocladiella mackenziei CBS 650.93 TaxID=1442369 RepID=A0A0D2FE17_9EURO|nr:uncharacterized protein Z518_10466 [Rhinocladiella mackenziei CBS 650.93]KIX00327.1 hypothetical protein Z518_10466 [Rhinocladiella mackenziei CBS 650.93]